MPCNYKDYPPNWFSEIRPAILKRSREDGKYEKCEWCGVPNGAVGYRVDGVFVECDDEHEAAELGDSGRLTKISLTIAHIFDMDKLACHLLNLAALCQRCHLLHDMTHHVQKRRANRDRRAGQGYLFDPDSVD